MQQHAANSDLSPAPSSLHPLHAAAERRTTAANGMWAAALTVGEETELAQKPVLLALLRVDRQRHSHCSFVIL